MASSLETVVDAPIIASQVRVPTDDASFLRAVLESIPAFVVRLDPDQRISYINHLRGGVTLDQVIGRPVREFIAPDDFERYEQAVAEALRTGNICSYVVKGSRPVRNEGAASYEGHVVPVDNGDGRRAVCIVATDVSEHLARARALEQSEEQLRIAVEATGIGLWTWDMAKDRIDWNQRMIELAGCEPMPLQEYMARFIHPDDRARMLREVSDAKDGRPSYLEHRVIRPDGQVRWFLPCGRITLGEDGRPARMVGGMLDITAQRMTDEHLRNSQRLDAIGCLTAGVAHNFNNMLAVIVPNLELALRSASVSQAQALYDALHAARRATELVAQLMTFGGQREALAVETHDLATLLRNAVSIARRTFGGHVQIDAMIDPQCANVSCVPNAIEQVILNLLINARDAVSEAGRSDPRIRVELCETTEQARAEPGSETRRYVRIRVQDNGAGMTDETKRRLFEPFFTTKEAGKGTGLGLATSYGILRDHRGRISFDSERGVGTTAEILLPMAEGESSPPRTASPPQAWAPGTILVADDERAIRRLLGVLLKERGHEVHLAADGAALVELLECGVHPDVIVLDRSMPGPSAAATVDAIRARLPTVPIVFFTGDEVPAAERSHVQDVLYKPLRAEELLQSIERWLPHRAPVGDAPPSAGRGDDGAGA